MNEVLKSLGRIYGGEFSEYETLRDFIGCVCKVRRGNELFALKLYRPFMADVAERASNIMERLTARGVRVPRVVKTAEGLSTCEITVNDTARRGVLMEFLEGEDIEEKDEAAADLLNEMRAAIAGYPLPVNGADFFVDRYVKVLTDMGSARALEYKALGNRLYERVKACPAGFCHGDFHNGNLIRENDGRIAVIDFDATATAFPAYDVVTYCDCTDYFNNSPEVMGAGFDKTLREMETLGRRMGVSDGEISAFPALLALRHFDIQATIIRSLGLDCVDGKFIDNQYVWLNNWAEIALARGFSI